MIPWHRRLCSNGSPCSRARAMRLFAICHCASSPARRSRSSAAAARERRRSSASSTVSRFRSPAVWRSTTSISTETIWPRAGDESERSFRRPLFFHTGPSTTTSPPFPVSWAGRTGRSAAPTLLLCDEPFSALDPLVRHELQEEFVALRDRGGVTMLFVTHDLGEAVRVGKRIVLIERGEILCDLPREGFLRSDLPLVRRFIEASRLPEV